MFFFIVSVIFYSFVASCEKVEHDNLLSITPRKTSKFYHRVLRFAFNENSKISFEFQLNFKLQLPIPKLGGMDVTAIVEFPLSSMLNYTFTFQPITIPYLVLSDRFASKVCREPQFSYDGHYRSGHKAYLAALKRGIRAASAQHRIDLFNSIAETLERFA